LKRAERQPAAFYLLIAATAWERFFYYGFRATLALFLMKRLDVGRSSVSEIMATIFAVTALAPLLGGYLADRFLGQRKAILAGGALMALGALAVGLELPAYPGLGLLIAGSSLIRPSIAALLGEQYRRGDPRRDGGFTLFYAAVNAAALLAPVVFGGAGLFASAEAAVLAMAAGMAIGAAVFAACQPLLPAEGYLPGEESAPAARLRPRDARDVALAVLGVACFVVAAVSAWPAVAPIWSAIPLLAKAALVVALVAAGFGVERARAGKDARPLPASAWHRVLVLVALAPLAALFWIQDGLVQESLSRFVFASASSSSSSEMQTWLFSFNPLLVIFLAPVFALAWGRIDASSRPISGLVKMAAGLLLMAASGAVATLGGAEIAVGPLMLATALGALGEICFAPVGMAMATRLAPPRSAAFTMAAWLAAPTLAASFTARLGARSLDEPDATSGFLVVAATVVAAAALFALTPLVKKRWMHGAEEPEPARSAGDPYRSSLDNPEGEAALPDDADARSSRQMITGALWAVGGLAVTLASYSAASDGPGGGRYMVTYGAIIYGVITFFRGLAGRGAPKDR